MQFFMKNLEMNRKRTKKFWPTRAGIFSNFPAIDLNFHGRWRDDIKTKKNGLMSQNLAYHICVYWNFAYLCTYLDFVLAEQMTEWNYLDNWCMKFTKFYMYLQMKKANKYTCIYIILPQGMSLLKSTNHKYKIKKIQTEIRFR